MVGMDRGWKLYRVIIIKNGFRMGRLDRRFFNRDIFNGVFIRKYMVCIGIYSFCIVCNR